MTYYKIIDGVRYDRKLLDLAEELTEGQGDGRLSVKDIQKLYNSTLDGRGITTVEIVTLEYILSEFNVTDKAEEWLKEEIDLFEPGSVPSIINRIVGEKYNKPRLTVLVSPRDVEEQVALPNNKVSFEQALDKAMISFLSDYSHPESPGAIVVNVFELFPGEVENAEVQIGFKLAEFFDNGELRLLPNVIWNDEEDVDFNPPENREPVADNWIFSLSLFDLSDHIFWVIIPRDSVSKVYNYGFN